RYFPAVSISLRGDSRPLAAVAGGEAALQRILFNVLVNACEGDARRQAANVEVIITAGEQVLIEILDDGPGLPPPVRAAAPGAGASNKIACGGIGLGIVAALVEASHGSLKRGNREPGGAAISVALPRTTNQTAEGRL